MHDSKLDCALVATGLTLCDSRAECDVVNVTSMWDCRSAGGVCKVQHVNRALSYVLQRLAAASSTW